MVLKRPGVTITETLIPLANAADGSGQSTAVFVGSSATGGPTDPTLVSSWQQFSQVYGGFGDGSSLLPFAVYEYFNNGGGACYVVRAVNATAVAATTTLQDAQATPENILTVTAKSAGKWGNGITVQVVPTSGGSADSFDLYVTSGSTTERFTDVSMDPSSTRNAISVVNSAYSGSAFVTLAYDGPSTWTSVNTPAATASPVALSTGADGTGTPDLVAATQKIGSVNGTFDVNLPGVNDSTTINALASWAASQNNVFLVVDGVKGAVSDTASANAAAQQALVSGGSAITESSYVAVYGPWQIADDPSSSVPGAQRLLPPGGFVLGQYARTDVLRSVAKPAAGVGTTLRGVLGPQFTYVPTDLDNLNEAGINVIRVIPGSGTCIFGARTTSKGMPDRYLSIRRSLISLENGLTNLTRFAIFEDNDTALRSTVTDLVGQYLRAQWGQGVLAGDTEEQAFFVTCDDSNNTSASVQQGILNIQIGVALQTPAEYIVFNIGQSINGTTVTSA